MYTYSFPGGNADATDATPTATALRETEEELGISPADVEVWGKLNSLPGRNFNVTPVIGHVRQLDMSQLRINQSEASIEYNYNGYLYIHVHLCTHDIRISYRIFRLGWKDSIWALLKPRVIGEYAPRKSLQSLRWPYR